MTRKLYSGPIVDVSFDGEVCQHSEVCIHGMPTVFDTKARPWINPGVANTPELADKLREVIGRCPSGALRVEEHDTAEQS